MRNATPHFHSHIEIIFVNKGTFKALLDGKTYTLTPGDCMLVFPGLIHNYFDTLEDNNTLMIVCSLHLTDRWKGWLTLNHADNPIISQDKMSPHSLYALQAIMEKRDTLGPTEEWEISEIYQTSILLQLFLSGFMPQLELKSKTSSPQKELTKKIIDYMMKEFSGPITLDQVANTLGVDKFRISRIFSRQLHTSFTRYLNELRIEEAKRLLSKTTHPITDIAFECGFSAIRTFNRAFSETTGMTPKQYRQLKNTY